MISPFDAWVVKRALVGHDLTDALPCVSRMLRPVVEHLGTLSSAEARAIAWQALLSVRPDREKLTRAVDDADPGRSPPEVGGARRSAHLGDLATSAASRQFVWSGWIVRGEFNLLSGETKVGKTHLMLDLARRLWLHEPLPNGNEAPLPAGTCTLWVCGGRHHNDLRARARAFGLPDEAVRLSARPEDPYGGWNLDEPKNVALLYELVEAERPGLVIINTVGHATRGHVRRQEKFHDLLEPIVQIAQGTDTAIVGLVHFPKGGGTLGRRLEGLACSVLKLTRPDPERQPARRKLTAVGSFKEPPALGVTFFQDHCEYDLRPPSTPARRGRPPDKIARAVAFLEEKLADGPRKAAELIQKWEEVGGNRTTLLNARTALHADGRLFVQQVQGLNVWMRTPMEPTAPGAAAPISEGGDRGQKSPGAQSHQLF